MFVPVGFELGLLGISSIVVYLLSYVFKGVRILCEVKWFIVYGCSREYCFKFVFWLLYCFVM